MEIFGQNSGIISVLSIILTVLAVTISTVYTLRNILKIWKAGEPKPVDDDESEEENVEEKIPEEGSEIDADTNAQNELHHNVNQGGDAGTLGRSEEIDPYEYCEHIQSEVKKAKQRVTAKRLQTELTPEQIQEEREVQRKQLEEIYKLMQTQEEKFGVESIQDVQNQMKLYV